MRALLNIACSLLIASSLLSPGLLQAKADAPAVLIEKELGGRILDAKPKALEKAITACIHQDRSLAPKLAPSILQSGRADANAIAPYLVSASIQALGKDITESELNALIYETVRVTPDAALEIVAAASREVPQNLLPTIVTAAIHAVPDPYKTVEYRKDTILGNGTATTRDFKGSYKDTTEAGVAETLAEAIVDAVADASGIGDRSGLVAAANTTFGNVLAPSALGVAGDPNYGNEPRVEAPTIPVVSK